MSTKVEHYPCKSVPRKPLIIKKMSTKLGSTKEEKNCICTRTFYCQIVKLTIIYYTNFLFLAGSIAPHIIMDENHADFLIIGGGLAGNVLANRIYNACQSVGITMSGRFFEEQERVHYLASELW